MTSRSRIALALTTAALAVAAACVPMAQPAGGPGGPGTAGTTGAVASSGGGGCAAACAHLLECQLVNDQGACAQRCQADGIGDDLANQLAAASCADDAQWLAQNYGTAGEPGGGGGGGGGGEGSSCTGGDSTCGGVTVCCASGGGQAAYGAPGVCHQVSVCNAPRY